MPSVEPAAAWVYDTAHGKGMGLVSVGGLPASPFMRVRGLQSVRPFFGTLGEGWQATEGGSWSYDINDGVAHVWDWLWR